MIEKKEKKREEGIVSYGERIIVRLGGDFIPGQLRTLCGVTLLEIYC
jgi:hypothetical protein